MRIKELLLSVILLFLVGCTEPSFIEPTITLEPSSTPTAAPTSTPTKTIVPTATITATPTTVPTATWAVQGPGEITAPILLYHHVDSESNSGLYNVAPEVFAVQMKALSDWGYTTITISDLVKAITTGAPLPPRPVVITFDDGNRSIYENAYPIMEQYGFVGVNYVVANRMKAEDFMGPNELEELYKAGWEVGSHSYTHADLSLDHSIAFYEIRHSKVDLAALLMQPVNTFAYPFGGFDAYLGDRVGRWGYTAAVGLGRGYSHTRDSLFYLQRIEIPGGTSLEQFAGMLPWSDPLE